MDCQRCGNDRDTVYPCVCGHAHAEKCDDCGCTEYLPDNGTDGANDYQPPGLPAQAG